MGSTIKIIGQIMKVTALKIPIVLLIEPQVFSDDRGFFFESFNQNKFEEAVGHKIHFVQDNSFKIGDGHIAWTSLSITTESSRKTCSCDSSGSL
jgi:hypothetical protein